MEAGKLAEWNPWWEDKGAIRGLGGLRRPKYGHLVDSVNVKEITVITGVRRAGKSTLMYQMIESLLSKGIDPKQILFVNLEDTQLANDSLEDIYSAYRENVNQENRAFLFLDEIHRKKGWEHWVRKKYDLRSNDKFVLSGSCSYLLKKEYSTLLTGRNLTFEVFPLGFGEFLLFQGLNVNGANLKKGILLEKTKRAIRSNFGEYLALGGFPEVILKTDRFKKTLLKQYFDDILYKDIIDRYDLSSQKVRDLALFLMTNATGFISLRNLRNSLQISYDTTKDYLSHFKDAFLFFTLEHFSYSLKEQKTLPSKIYCIDNGLRNAVSFTFSKDEGKNAENTVLVELKSQNKEVYYWKGGKNHEVDFIVKNEDNSLTAINVSYSNEIREREMRGLLEFKKQFKKTKELIVLTKDAEKKEGKIKFVPLWKWLLES